LLVRGSIIIQYIASRWWVVLFAYTRIRGSIIIQYIASIRAQRCINKQCTHFSSCCARARVCAFASAYVVQNP